MSLELSQRRLSYTQIQLSVPLLWRHELELVGFQTILLCLPAEPKYLTILFTPISRLSFTINSILSNLD